MLYYVILGVMVFFIFCTVMSAYYIDKTRGIKAKVFCGIFFTCFLVSCVSLLAVNDEMLKTETLEVKDITIKVYYIDGTNQTFSFSNVRKWYPKIRHYKGDYSIRVEEYGIVGGYRYDVLKQTNKTITFEEFHNSRKQ